MGLGQGPGGAGSDTDRTFRIRFFVVQRGGHSAVLKSQEAGDQFGGAAGGAEVAEVTLGSKHRCSAVAKDFQQAPRFPTVGLDAAATVRVDVINVFRTNACLFQGGADGAGQTGAGAAAIESRPK